MKRVQKIICRDKLGRVLYRLVEKGLLVRLSVRRGSLPNLRRIARYGLVVVHDHLKIRRLLLGKKIAEHALGHVGADLPVGVLPVKSIVFLGGGTGAKKQASRKNGGKSTKKSVHDSITSTFCFAAKKAAHLTVYQYNTIPLTCQTRCAGALP